MNCKVPYLVDMFYSKYRSNFNLDPSPILAAEDALVWIQYVAMQSINHTGNVPYMEELLIGMSTFSYTCPQAPLPAPWGRG